jgi:hypothetical protein
MLSNSILLNGDVLAADKTIKIQAGDVSAEAEGWRQIELSAADFARMAEAYLRR